MKAGGNIPARFEIPRGAPYYCVVGSPIGHSKSPEIHQAFARQFGIALRYERVEIKAQNFAANLTEFIAAGGSGMNVTVPLKEEAWAAVSERSEAATLSGAVNTIKILGDGRAMGHNTDGFGLLRDLTVNLGQVINSARILLIGAGGAARGVLPQLLGENPTAITLVNRTHAKAAKLAQQFSTLGSIKACTYSDLAGQQFDILINATSLGLIDESPPVPVAVLRSANLCYDMMYTVSGRTAFLDNAAANGVAATHDGLGMLVEQAAKAFHIWHDVEPATAAVMAALRP